MKIHPLNISSAHMKLKLLHKIFLANISVILLLSVILLSFSYFSFKEMTNYLMETTNKQEIYMVSELATKLDNVYSDEGSWQAFTLEPARWRFFIHDAMDLNPKPRPRAKNHKGKFNKQLPPHRRENKGRFANELPPRHRGPKDALVHQPPPNLKPYNRQPNANSQEPVTLLDLISPPRHIQKSFLSSRIALFDRHKKTIVKAELPNEILHYEAIKVKDNIVGWVGLTKIDLAQQHGNVLLSHQFKQIVIMALIGIILSAIVSFYLARHFIAPIRNLTQGAIKLSERKFDTKIKIESNDELADLAYYFNDIGIRLSRFETVQKQWLQDIAHELRTPLTILRGEIEAMVDGVNPATKDNLTQLKHDVLRLNSLIDDLHELSVTDNLLLTRDAERINLQDVCNCAEGRFEALLSKKNIKLITSFKEGRIQGDASRLLQIIDNLIANCVKYTDHGGSVWFSCYKENNKALLVIEDSGPGVHEDDLDKLFDRLYRIDHHRNRNYGGAGLGLSICKNIVVAHHGDIYATTSNKGGLKITITLPIDESEK